MYSPKKFGKYRVLRLQETWKMQSLMVEQVRDDKDPVMGSIVSAPNSCVEVLTSGTSECDCIWP